MRQRVAAWCEGHWQLLALTAAVALFWNTDLLVPLKILIVFFHEVSHGLAAVLTGGELISLTVTPNQGGLATTRGGSPFWILTAGYLGSLLIGVALLLAGLRSDADRWIVAGLGLLLLGITVFYMDSPFAVTFGFVTGAGLLLMARFLPHDINDLMLRLIGLTSMIYVPRDIFSDTIARAHLRSDAFMLAERFGGTAQAWGAVWLAVSALTILGCLIWGLGRDSNIHFR